MERQTPAPIVDLDRLRQARDPRRTAELVEIAIAQPEGEAAAEAAQILRARGGREEFDAAMRMTRAERWEERRLGAEILGQMGWNERTFLDDSVSRLLELVDDDQREVEIAALFALGHRGSPRAMDALIERVANADVEVREGVAFALPQTGDDERAVAALQVLMRDEDADVRDWATFGLGTQLEECDGDEIRAALFERTRDEDPVVRGEALMGLARRRDPRVPDLLRAELGRAGITTHAAEAAELLADSSLVEPLRSAVTALANDPDCDADALQRFQAALAACERASATS